MALGIKVEMRREDLQQKQYGCREKDMASFCSTAIYQLGLSTERQIQASSNSAGMGGQSIQFEAIPLLPCFSEHPLPLLLGGVQFIQALPHAVA